MGLWGDIKESVAVAIVAAVLLLAAIPAAAEKMTHVTTDDRRIFTLAWENDIGTGNDDNYTNGVRVAYLSAEDTIPDVLDRMAGWVPFFAPEGRKRWGLEVGQSMFTPEDITTNIPDPADRPYAGILYGSVMAVSDTGYNLDRLQLTFGVVGPASLASETQEFFHALAGARDPKGWDSQLHNEPVLMLSYEHKWRNLFELTPFGWGFDITPSIGGSMGNIYTQAAVGAVARFGFDLPADYGPPIIKPSLSGSDFFKPSKALGWYVFAGAESRAVAQNIFLDGNSFRDSPRIEKLPFIHGAQAGIAFVYDNTRIAYTHIFNSKEFKGQKGGDQYGAVTLSVRF
ncbi:MAG: lipid A deacylase LpxR family protein [Bdellovibrionales bacterium]